MKNLKLVTLTEAMEYYHKKKGESIGRAFILNSIYRGDIDGVQTSSRLWLIKKRDVLKLKKGKAGAPFGNYNNKYGKYGKAGKDGVNKKA